MKTCIKCRLEKEIHDFPFRDKNKIITRNTCLLCTKKYKENYYKQHKLVLIKKACLNYSNNKEKIIENVRVYRKNNKDLISEYKKEYYDKNKEKIQQYRLDNKDYIQNYQNKRRQKRRKNDPVFKIRTYISNSIRDILKGRKKEATWKNISYTPLELKEHLESQFESWMTWNNHGMYNKNTWNDNNSDTWTWQIDHIIPHSTFKYTSMEDQSFKDCWALSNLRPLKSIDNIKKGNRI